MLRRAATLVYVALVVVPFAFLAVARALPWNGAAPELRTLLFWVSIGASVFSVTLSRVLPPRVAAAREGPETTGFVRLLLGWALCEAAILLPLVAFIVTRDPRLIGVFVVDLLALVLLAPTEGTWQAALPTREEEDVSERRRLVAGRGGPVKER